MPRTISPWAALVPLAGLVTFVAIYYFFTQFGNQAISGIEANAGDAAAYLESRIRMQWFAAIVAFTFVSVVAVGSFLVDLFAFETQSDSSRAWRYDKGLRTLAAAVFILACIGAFGLVFGDNDRFYYFLGRQLFEAVFDICTVESPDGGSVPLAECFGPLGARASFDRLFQYGASMAIAGVTACALGSALSLARRTGEPYTGHELSHARYYLYISSALLSFGLLGMMAWMRLPLSVITDATAQVIYTEHVKSVVLYWGVSFSVVILSYNLPTMAALHMIGVAPTPAAEAPDKILAKAAMTPETPVTTLREVVSASIAFLTPALLPLSVELGGNLLSFLGGSSGG